MGSHPILFEDLIAYAAGTLDAQASAVVASHLDICAECTSTILRFQAIGEILRTDDTQVPSPRAILRAQKLYAQRPRMRQPSWLETGWMQLFSSRNFSPVTAILVLLLINLIVYVGFSSVLAQNATPGDWLYPLKTTMEELDLKTTRSDGGKAQLHLALAGKRVEEIRTQVERQEFQKIPETAATYETHVEGASGFLNSVFQRDLDQAKQLAQALNQNLSHHVETLTTLSQSVPDEIKPALQHAIATSGSAISVALRVLSTPVLTGQRTPTPLVVTKLAITPTVPRPAPSNTFVVPIPSTGASPGVAPTTVGKPGVATPVPGKPPAATAPSNPPSVPTEVVKPPPLMAERCQGAGQPKPSGYIKNLTMAEKVRSSDGEPENPTEEFKPNSKIFAVANIQNAPANTRFKALWCVTDVGKADVPDAKIGEAAITTFGTRNAEFSLTPSKGWAVGRYRIEIYVNGVLDTVRHFRVK